ncbi:MAG: PAS domain S-box protein, partial [bacterium]|nr:PAS domain S-box protein [bacterium]
PCEETYWFCHSPAVQQKLRDSIRRAAQGEPCRYDMVIRVGEDRSAVIDFSLRPLRDETGKITYLIPSATDITERTQAEDRLRASEARYRAIIEDQTELVCRCLPDKTHTFVNDAYCRCFGQTYEELIGCSIMPLIPEEHHARVLAHFAALSSECPVATYEHRVIVASGETRWHQWTDRAIFDAEGTIVEYQSVGRDITERRQVEIALRKSEERFRTLVDAGKDAVIAIDREGLITIFNPAAERMFGWRRAEVAGQPLDRLMPDEYRAPHREYVRGYFHTGNPRGAVGQTLELSAMRKGGSAFPIELSLSVGQHGNEPFALTVIRDITERKRAEEALRDSEERYRALFEQAPDAVVLIDGQNGALLEFNDRAHENLGYTRAEFQHLTLEEIRAGELPEGIASQIARIMEKGTETFDSKHRTKSGEIRDVRVTARAVTVRGRVLFQSVWSDITEQKRSEEARQRQALVFGNIYDGVLVTDLEGRITDWNPGAERMFGYSREEVLGRSPEILNRPQEAADVTRRIREAVNTTGRWSGELCYVRRDGTEGVCEVILVRLVDLYGQPVGNVSVNRDATERKRAEQALRESMDELARVTEEQRLLLTHTRDFVYRHNTEGVFTYLSPSIEQITGYTVEEWHTHYTTYMTDHPLNQKVRDYTEETLRTGRPGPPYLVEVRHKNGHHIMLEVNERPYHADGEVAGIIGVARDVTERVRIDQALRESERRFRLVTRATRDAIYDWDIIADRSWRNERYLEWFAPPADTSYDWWASRLHQDDRARVETSLREALDSLVDNWSTEYRLLRADEEYAHILARGWIMRDPTGRPLRMIGAMTDITERIKAEDLARRRQAELARVMRVNTMGEMAAGLAHELNQPLAAIANYAKGSLRRIECESVALVDLVEPIRRISEQASRAGEIIRRIREFVGQVEPRRSAVDLGEVIREVTSLAEYEARTRSIHIELELAAGLPPAYADRIQVQQVVLNLVRNALEASGGLPNADQAVTIATELSDCGGLLVAVRDQGAGIDPDHADQIFEPFFTSRKTGMGMGLAICRSIVSGHGGRIWATPNPGGGTILSFTLPTASEPEAGQRQPASP